MKFRNKSGDTRWLPDLALNVEPGGTFEATGDLAQAYLDQPDLYVRVDKPERPKTKRARRAAAAPATETTPTETPETTPAPGAADTQE